jgi:hypothetical protein
LNEYTIFLEISKRGVKKLILFKKFGEKIIQNLKFEEKTKKI